MQLELEPARSHFVVEVVCWRAVVLLGITEVRKLPFGGIPLM